MDIHELIQRVLHKEVDDYNEIIKMYYTEIYAYVLKQVGDHELSKEICQDIFFEAYRNLKAYNAKKASFRTWLYKIASYTCIDYFRSKAYQQKQMTQIQDEIDDVARENRTLIQLIQKEDTQKISDLMHKLLKPKHERIMRYHFFAELSVTEISNLEKMSAKSIYSIIDRSLLKLRQALGVNEHD